MLVPLIGTPAEAADQATDRRSSMTTVAAEELNQRSKQPATGQNGGLSERGVRNMVYYAFSLIPDEVKGPDGKMVPVDKADPNKFVIPEDDARRVIRAATRSAYADVCGLPNLAQANYEAMLTKEKAQQSWSREQLLMIEALHLFAVSFFTGNASFSTEPDSDSAEGEGAAAQASGEPSEVHKAPPPPKCPPEQRQRVESAINAYVASAGAQ
ncbi:hypothetical protein AUC68_06435 [Methyloceanibacter methanicus]|uniref:Uncharacterized protein n=2 Tax=Methyloceanibacter methanicus TaxID=1774968 RepID=A0A1E3VZ89_9HYPH|nr:hypothetical protein AUC68_06435 [Methyloceanibacter methanicus]